MKISYPIITSILDTDLYKLTQQQVVFHDFPDAVVEYGFTNRGGTKFPDGFADELRAQLVWMSDTARLTFQEKVFLSQQGCFQPTYLEWLKSYVFNPNEVDILQTNDGQLEIKICGYWYRTILWEVPLMALISELYFKLTGQKLCDDWSERIVNKAKKLSCEGVVLGNTIPHLWSDFGTRRRYSLAVQDMVVCVMKNYKGFLGTSNPMLAMKYKVKPIGTMAHEFIMGCSAKYGVILANKMAMKHWSDFYRGELDVVLPDTFTTDVFLRDFDKYAMKLFGGIRQDSGSPIEWMDTKVVPHYNKMGMKPERVIFSDGLDVDKFIALSNLYRDYTKVIGGIGTNLTNDVGNNTKPLNMVIKLTKANFGNGMINVVKLSDNSGKHTGNKETITLVKNQLNIS